MVMAALKLGRSGLPLVVLKLAPKLRPQRWRAQLKPGNSVQPRQVQKRLACKGHHLALRLALKLPPCKAHQLVPKKWALRPALLASLQLRILIQA